jgi:hypothetical protein
MGLQLNLYPMGLSAASGAGRPPHSDTKRVTLPPLPCRPLIKRSADMWSMPEGGGGNRLCEEICKNSSKGGRLTWVDADFVHDADACCCSGSVQLLDGRRHIAGSDLRARV